MSSELPSSTNALDFNLFLPCCPTRFSVTVTVVAGNEKFPSTVNLVECQVYLLKTPGKTKKEQARCLEGPPLFFVQVY